MLAPDCPPDQCEHPGVSHAEMLRLVARACACGHRQERHVDGPCETCTCEGFRAVKECA